MPEREYAKANDVAQMVNPMGFSYEEFCREMSNEHRTLQQNFTRLCLEWFKHCAKEDYRYDLRNERTHEVAKLIVEKLGDELYTPYI